MKNRLQLRYHFPDKLPTRNEAINYINDIFSIDANDGLTSLIAEPLVVFYNNDTTLNRRRSIESANVILAIGRGGDGTNVEKNKDYFIIDFAKNVEDINKINEIIGKINDDESVDTLYGIIAKNLKLINEESSRATEAESDLQEQIEKLITSVQSEIQRAIEAENSLMGKINEEFSRATEAENELLLEINNNKIDLQEQITKNKVISSDKTIIVNTDSPSNTNISVNVDNSTIKIDERTGKLSVAPEAFIKYDGENAIKITDKENYTKEISLVINPNDKILSNSTEGIKSTLYLEYVKDDENKPLLRLIGKDNETISSINVSDFINDGMIQSVELKEEQDKKYLVITWNTAAGKEITKLDISSLIDTYTAGNGINLNSGEFSIKLKTEQSLLESDELGLYVNEGVLNNIIKNNTENLIDNKITERFNESKDYTNQQISEVEKDISHYISDLEKNIETSEQNAKHYADDLKNEINNDITDLTNKDNYLENSITSLNQEINNIESNITNLQQNKLDTIKISGNVIIRNGTEINIPLGVGLKLDKDNSYIKLDINEDFEATTEGISISNKFKSDITNNIEKAKNDATQYTVSELKKVTDEQALVDQKQDAILAGFGEGQEFTTVKDALDKKVNVADGYRLMSDAEATKLEGIEAGAQVNIIESLKLNDTTLAVVEDKSVKITAIEGVCDGEQVIMLGADNKISTNLSIAYDSDAKEIKLMSGETQIGAAIDATDFIKDGMVNSAKLEERTVEGVAKTYLILGFNTDGGNDVVEVDITTLLNIEQISGLEKRVKANEEAIDAIETAMGDWTAATQAEKDTAQDSRLTAIEEKSSIWDSSEQKAKDYADRKISLLDGSRHLPLDGEFNINKYTNQGIYYFKGERINANDNLPIINAAPGHSISVQLTVLDASLSDAEMCVSQYLKLTNRTGSEGKEYIRTYNKYSDGTENWSAWREIKQTTNLNQITDEDLKNYTENGMYEGAIYNGNDTENPPSVFAKFIADISTADGATTIPSGSLFSMQVLNNYAVIQKAEQMGLRMPQSIVQIAKVLLINSQFVEVVRTYIGESNNWSNWKISSVIIGS